MHLRLGEDSNLWTLFLRLLLRVLMAWLFEWKVFAAEPSFGVPAVNVTVVEGDTAVLECSILHLTEDHQVVWTDSEGFVLTHNDKRIVDDQRLSIERPFKQMWNLHIRDVRYKDRGKYVCQISTQPPKHKDVILNVLVPPYIIEQYSSNDVTVQEGDTVILVCNATGLPQPEITWFKYSADPMQLKQRIEKQGEILMIHNVTRDCGGSYVCEASNGVEPQQSREMKVVVQYPPEVFLLAARLGQHPGRETFLQCEVTAHPHGTMFWEKDGRDLAADRSGKYNVEIFNSDLDQKKILSLRIKQITNDDFGRYTCVADNFVGEDKETMILYENLCVMKYSVTKASCLSVQVHEEGFRKNPDSFRTRPIKKLDLWYLGDNFCHYSVHMRRYTTTTTRQIIVQPSVTSRWIPQETDVGVGYNPGRRNNHDNRKIENVGAIRGENDSSHPYMPMHCIVNILIINCLTVFNLLTS